jgi:hypothetical protein
MARSRYFTVIDIEKAFWNIPKKMEDRDKNGFVTTFGSFRYEKMAFRLSGAPCTFQSAMDNVLLGLKDIEYLIYLGDVLIENPTIEEHAWRIKLVFGL